VILAKSDRKVEVVKFARSEDETPTTAARVLATSTTYAGSLRWPRCGTGAR
jgi:hypothetical protein